MKFTAQLHIPLVRWPTRAGKFDVQIAPTVNDAAGQADVPRTQSHRSSAAAVGFKKSNNFGTLLSGGEADMTP
jgi:hypothetical protein